jgi:hypothetical protein
MGTFKCQVETKIIRVGSPYHYITEVPTGTTENHITI